MSGMKLNMSINGSETLKRSLRDVGPKNAVSIARQSLRKPAKFLETQVKNETPIRTEDYGIQDGVLRLSIEAVAKTKNKVPFVVIGPSNNPAWTNMNLGTKLTQVAHRVEYGHPKYRITGWRGGYYNRKPIVELESQLPPHSFIRTTADLHGDQAMQYAANEMSRLITRKLRQINAGGANRK